MEETWENEFKDQLMTLHRQVKRMKERGDEALDIEARMGAAELYWQDRLVNEQRTEVSATKAAIEFVIDKLNTHELAKAAERHAGALLGMSPENQVRYWNTVNHGSLIVEHDRARFADTLTKQMTAAINEKFNNYQYGLIKAHEEIENGQAPSLARFASRQVINTLEAAAKDERNAALLELLNQERDRQRGDEREH